MKHGDEIQSSISYGLRNIASFETIKTYQGNYGIGGSLGISIYPVPLPVNITVDIPNKK
ncbi:MAG: hypothetical protein SFV53_02480 [Rickettsiales bacterium]|nr:hypothetical protein [Rickettsiales bacterium]